MTFYHSCPKLTVKIKVMSRGTLFELNCSKLGRSPTGRECKDCIYEARAIQEFKP